jgi:DNA-directed RNA polymerase subunit H (RpoH/RPB5)
MASSNKVLRIYKSRKTILDLLETYQNYDVSDYNDFSINEIDAMLSNEQLDMLVQRKSEDSVVKPQKTYIKYYLQSKQIRPQTLDDIIEDLYLVENILTKDDTLIIIIEDEPNDTIIAKLNYLYNTSGIFIVIHNIKRLQFNILQHKLVPNMSILSKKEVEELMQKFNLKTVNQLPEIGRFDPQALALSMRPGDVCEINRDSVTSIEYDYYRVCV